jgi:hypothetical protein
LLKYKLKEKCDKQTEINKKFEESLLTKRKTVNLIQDAPKNVAKLNDEIENYDKKMQLIEIQYNEHKVPYEDEIKRLKNEYDSKKLDMQKKLFEIKKLRDDYKILANDLIEKEKELDLLNKDFESLRNDPKTAQNTNRQFYTKRILEIVANIEKQKREIDKVFWLALPCTKHF